MQNNPAVRQFLMSFSAGLTAIGIVNLIKWLREPALRRRV
jgi:hypothetical protein